MAIDEQIKQYNNNVPISEIKSKIAEDKNIQLDLLRLDLLHPQISGNKWFKLKYNIEFAIQHNFTSILSFGGAYSNHLHALAYAGKLYGIQTIAVIRGEKIENNTLADCKKWGMQLHFVSRNEYKNKTNETFLQVLQQQYPHAYIVNEGGNNLLGQKGCEEILQQINIKKYQYYCCAVGTGATFTGIVNTLQNQQQALGFCAIKNGHYLQNEIQQQTSYTHWTLIHDYHMGGFAKKNENLIQFIQEFNEQHQIELDFVYTAKMMIGIFDKIKNNDFEKGTKILAIHTGGLQGNRSL